MSSSSRPTPRLHQATGAEEAESTLNLGEFTDTPTLSLSEARLLISAVIHHRTGPQATKETETLVKTQDYLDVFARFKQPENIDQVDRLMRERMELENFEKSQLGESFSRAESEGDYLRRGWRLGGRV